jgi:hypothetical protein
MLGVPLAIIACLLANPLMTPLALVAAWWWSPRDRGWEWLVAIGRGVIGTEWALLGANGLAAFPQDRLAVVLCWVQGAAMLGVLSVVARRPDPVE